MNDNMIGTDQYKIPEWWKRDTLSTRHVDNGVCSMTKILRMCLHCQKVHGGMYFRATSARLAEQRELDRQETESDRNTTYDLDS